MPSVKEQILAYLDNVSKLGEAALKNRFQSDAYVWLVRADAAAEFLSSYSHLLSMLGPHAASWKPRETKQPTYVSNIEWSLGNLRSIRRAIESGLLLTVESLAAAEVFSDFLEQAEHLREKGFYVAAAVLGRGVLEEHLRKSCAAKGCFPTRTNPTINDYNLALYPAHHDKAAMQHITAMATVGNDAAHEQKATDDGVKQMLGDVRRFLAQHLIS